MDAREFDIPRYLSVLPLFNDLSPVELQHVADGSILRRMERGDIVFRMGDPCNEFHVVVTGQIKLYMISSSGQEKVVDLVGPGQSFGEALMFTQRPYILNAQALGDTLLLTVSRLAVVAGIERDHRFALRMLAGLSRRMHGLVRDVEAYALHTGLQRVIGFLLGEHLVDDTAADGPLVVALPVSKATIASRLSLTPEYFSRVLHELEAQGLIEIERRVIRVPNRQRLAAYQKLPD